MSTVAISACWYPGLYSSFYCIPSFLLPASPCFCGVGLSTFSPNPPSWWLPPKKNIWWTLEHDTPHHFGGVEDKRKFLFNKIYLYQYIKQAKRAVGRTICPAAFLGCSPVCSILFKLYQSRTPLIDHSIYSTHIQGMFLFILSSIHNSSPLHQKFCWQ